MSRKYTEPHAIKSKLLAWSELNLNEVENLIGLFQNQSTNDCYNYLERIFELSSARFRDRILLDLLFFATKFAVCECAFGKIQISSFVSIIRALHKYNEETPFDNFKILLEYFHDLMVCHSVHRPPFCLKIFDSQQAAKSISFVKNTYFKNYKLYKYAFTPNVGINLKLNYSNEKPNSNDTPITYYPELSIKTLHHQHEQVDMHKALNLTPPKILPMVLPELSTIPTMSSFSSEIELKNYVRQFLVEELDSEPIREKLFELEEEVFRSKHNL